ncbi:hypothetical protein ABT341_17300, partial [Pseudonocardia alni]
TGTDGRLTGVPSTPAAAPAASPTAGVPAVPATTVPATAVPATAVPATAPDLDPGRACSVDDPDCEACQ